MASSIPVQIIQNPVLGRSSFLRKTRHSSIPSRTTTSVTPSAKLQLSDLLGGRGLCNGEVGLYKELNQDPAPCPATPQPRSGESPSSLPRGFGDDAFEKELLGLTGGFPGGEKGLKKFIEENPPIAGNEEAGLVFSGSKPKPPELPLLLPGMIVVVKNPKNPFYMYCGIVQRVTDGKVGVLFEGGNWDKLITFRLDELERRDKGPPMVNPKSAVLEAIVQKSA
ncbi:NAD(P)H-quinone oxidoreductase subunit S, chloroplastic [Elaeis guineensis]|uniref:NAD(P)H-quinone oxidoreductase subunit S, chloroplastic n=1 Tax=Elaeis guineensis var. tenera TaxID=51953 RepID=A0A6I9QGS8_ELAGV|nr:NAD(P)H-quinone oxidoreductase subunit S, chloroplastic [Elaeis guineensis]XP_010909312.1 NAD(P)H-quinone oxidoreductase subunit S, chloroplastic [Elaeis guineensis]XP_010909313.1 NAD(P)H-quinone oxidoreductase subunit S, chloroplastic [Elaeis guineensis]XP_029117789.1 NAD(P)H-quinone oxidoreductase subunit S, chloroplastic [Elaeis guineensis]XP_029117790.1 NAD(P)H-quinone oxidoreductase subunit S, chloroplastic [Elaeis guineensis]XP_029117791.1 NAD(P)H-quinone oxidoreductase subunit S, chl